MSAHRIAGEAGWRTLATVLWVVLAVVVLTACTTIERVAVNTVVANCDVERGDEKSGNGGVEGNVLAQQAAAAAAFAGSLRSVIICHDGTVLRGEVEGGAVEAGQ